MGVGYAQNLLLGSGKLPHNRFQFDLGFSSLGVVADERPARDDCACRRAIGWSDQARADRSVSQPSHWARTIITLDDLRLPGLMPVIYKASLAETNVWTANQRPKIYASDYRLKFV